MPNYTVIDAEGNILRSGAAPNTHISLQAQPGEVALKMDAKDTLHWVDPVTTERKDKIPFPITRIANTITGIPDGTKLQGEGFNQVITDGALNYVSNRKGEHRLVLTHKEYLTEVVVISI